MASTYRKRSFSNSVNYPQGDAPSPFKPSSSRPLPLAWRRCSVTERGLRPHASNAIPSKPKQPSTINPVASTAAGACCISRLVSNDALQSSFAFSRLCRADSTYTYEWTLDITRDRQGMSPTPMKLGVSLWRWFLWWTRMVVLRYFDTPDY